MPSVQPMNLDHPEEEEYILLFVVKSSKAKGRRLMKFFSILVRRVKFKIMLSLPAVILFYVGGNNITPCNPRATFVV